jgi:hypothetical protein
MPHMPGNKARTLKVRPKRKRKNPAAGDALAPAGEALSSWLLAVGLELLQRHLPPPRPMLLLVHCPKCRVVFQQILGLAAKSCPSCRGPLSAGPLPPADVAKTNKRGRRDPSVIDAEYEDVTFKRIM